jgi:hypothetical protein
MDVPNIKFSEIRLVGAADGRTDVCMYGWMDMRKLLGVFRGYASAPTN